MDNSFHYPPEVFNLLVETIPLLCKSKPDVLLFFRGAGVSEQLMNDLAQRVKLDRANVNKYEIVRTIIQRLNEKGDTELRTRREVIKRIVEFEDYSTCWSNDQLKAKGLVSEIRRVVNVKDTFTRMSQERQREQQKRVRAYEAEIDAKKKKAEQIQKVKKELYELFSMEDEPQKRGKHLEKVLNGLFSSYGILVKEDFRRVDPDGAGVIEQIDGVIDFNGHVYLVEMKWVKKPIGVDQISRHLVRVYGRSDARGLFIASDGYADSTIAECRNALSQKAISLVTLREIVALLENQRDLVKFLEEKVQAALVDKNPYLEILN